MAQETTKKMFVICDKCLNRIYDGEPAITAWIDASHGYFETRHLLLDSEKDKLLTWYENKEDNNGEKIN